MNTTATSPPSPQWRTSRRTGRHRLRSIVGLLAIGALATAACDGAEPFDAQFSISPTSGPSGTASDVAIVANESGRAFELSDGTETVRDVLDGAGRFDTSWEFVGEPGEEIDLELVVIGDDGTSEFEDTVTFTITAPPGGSEEPPEETAEEEATEEAEETAEEDEATAEEDEETAEADETAEEATVAVDVEVTVDPATGPAGENATITVKGAPNSPVTLTINGVGSTGGTTDADGNYTFETTFTGDDGDEIPVEAEVGVGADTRSGSATYTIDNPESACSVTAEDLIVTQFHDTGSLDPALAEAGALSSIRVETDACEFGPDTWFVAISDTNASGTVDTGDAFFIAPQPAAGGNAEMGIDRGGNYFIGIIPPGQSPTIGDFTGLPFENPTPTDNGWQPFESNTDILIDLVERLPDDPTPGFFNVDFGDPVMAPQP